jgi:hypothetical protein
VRGGAVRGGVDRLHGSRVARTPNTASRKSDMAQNPPNEAL